MTPTQKLKERLNDVLDKHGMEIYGDLDYQRGAHRRMDICRWFGAVTIKHLSPMPHWTIASWDTVTLCLSHGFKLEFNGDRAEAEIMVYARVARAHGLDPRTGRG